VPLLLVFGDDWGATGAAAAMVVSTSVFCLLWVVLLARVHGEHTASGVLAS
jgi:Na+-driven multidrug efflux pump